MSLQYRDSTNLRARIRLYDFAGDDGVDWSRWVFEQLKLPDTARILDLGRGPEALWLRNLERIPH